MAVAALAFVVLGIAQYAVQRRMLLPYFEVLERDQAHATMGRLTEALQRELDVVALSARDWGNWIESYNFVLAPSDDFINVNINARALRAIHVDAIAYIDLRGHLVFSRAYDPVTGSTLDVDLFKASEPARRELARGAAGEAREVSGITTTSRGPMLLALAPILSGSGVGHPAGTLLLARFLKTDDLAAAANLPPASVRLVAAPHSGALGHDLMRRDEAEIEITHLLVDLGAEPVGALAFTTPRSISAKAETTLMVASALLVAVAGVTLGIFLGFLNRAVFDPLLSITRHAAEIGDSDDLSKRLHRQGSDELAVLASTFDGMVERLARTRSELIDKSFSAGIAEMASGALHNLGNALTPLSLRITALGDTLRRAPAEDMELVAAELAAARSDPARQADLAEFSRLAGLELARAVTAARNDADSAARQLQGIQRILTDQVRKGRAGPVLEPLRLDALVRQAEDLVADAARDRLLVEIAESVRALGPMRLPATMLRQVFQNLIVNAAEANADYPARRTRLSVEAGIRDDGARQLLVCRFTDDGGGIDPRVLPRLFEREFSTKSKDTNSGIGLHWCANALRAAGGEIRVSSDGAGKGACFEVTVPLPVAVVSNAAQAA